MATASSISPSGMQLAGKYGIGVLSIASNSTEGINALPTQWGFAEEAAAQHGSTVDRADWRVLMAFHLAETARAGAQRGRPRAAPLAQRVQRRHPRPARRGGRRGPVGRCSRRPTGGGADGAGTAVIGTPDDMVAMIRTLQETTGGFGVVLGFAHDWANREATLRSWELFARYVIPEITGRDDATSGRRSASSTTTATS